MDSHCPQNVWPVSTIFALSAADLIWCSRAGEAGVFSMTMAAANWKQFSMTVPCVVDVFSQWIATVRR